MSNNNLRCKKCHSHHHPAFDCQEGGKMSETQEDVQEKINLTKAQEKAFNALTRAVKKCKEENIFFYQVLEHIGALNGNNVRSVANIEEFENIRGHEDPRILDYLYFPTAKTSCSWTDDTHIVLLK